jgi:hypothetical protein
VKPGDWVTHSAYGTGKVNELRKAGLEARVAFHTGVVLFCPVTELRPSGQISDIFSSPQPTPTEHVAYSSSAKQSPQSSTTTRTDDGRSGARRRAYTRSSTSLQPLGDDNFLARQSIEALRLGVVPQAKVSELTVGFQSERQSIETALEAAVLHGGEVRAIVGEYGAGKSHLFEWTSAESLKRNYLVARASLDGFEVPPNKPNRIYNELICSLRYPSRTDGGSLGPLFDELIESGQVSSVIKRMVRLHERCSLADALILYERCQKRQDSLSADVVLRWIAGEKTFVAQVKAVAEGSFTRICSTMSAADQFCYLLTGIGWLAKQAGYAGLVVLLDEAEHYNSLTYNRLYAETFFKGMIYAALDSNQSKIRACSTVHGFGCGLAHGSQIPYPFRYADESSLVFMFAVTTSAPILLSLAQWLDDVRIIRLENKLSEGEIERLMAQIYVFHRRAYAYDRKEDFVHVGSALVRHYESGLINLRQLVRLSTEVFDLIYSYPDYHFDAMTKEIDSAFA